MTLNKDDALTKIGSQLNVNIKTSSDTHKEIEIKSADNSKTYYTIKVGSFDSIDIRLKDDTKSYLINSSGNAKNSIIGIDSTTTFLGWEYELNIHQNQFQHVTG